MRIFTDRKGYKRWKNTGNLVHIDVARNKVGGRIFGGYVVHHRDGNKSNFRIGNLRIMSRSAHSRLHAKRRY